MRARTRSWTTDEWLNGGMADALTWLRRASRGRRVKVAVTPTDDGIVVTWTPQRGRLLRRLRGSA